MQTWVWEDGETSDEGEQEQVYHGSLWLGTDGCGLDWHLIVTGPERGHVWWVCGEGVCPTDPKMDFLRWYEDWLDGKEYTPQENIPAQGAATTD